MKKPDADSIDLVRVLQSAALKNPETEVGVACAGTTLEKRTIKVRGKAFLFLGAKDAMLKLQTSLPKATSLAKLQPGRFKVGANGWTTIAFGDSASLSIELLFDWIDESYRILAPKQLVASLTEVNAKSRNAGQAGAARVRRKRAK